MVYSPPSGNIDLEEGKITNNGNENDADDDYSYNESYELVILNNRDVDAFSIPGSAHDDVGTNHTAEGRHDTGRIHAKPCFILEI